MRKLIWVFCCVAFAFALAAPAHAGPSLDFNVAAHSPSIGSISYAGGANPLVGAGIHVDTVTGLSTPFNSGAVLTLANTFLNFTSGNMVTFDPFTWFFQGGGTISVIGDIPALGLVGATLLTGSFTAASVTAAGGAFHVAISSFNDIKDPDLVNFFFGAFGPPGDKFSGNFNLSFMATPGVPPASFTTVQMLSGDIINDPIPEPATLFLLGTGLAAFGRWRRRK